MSPGPAPESPAAGAGRQYPARPIIGVGGVILVRLTSLRRGYGGPPKRSRRRTPDATTSLRDAATSQPDTTTGAAHATKEGTAAAPQSGVVLIRRRFEPLAGCWSLPGGGLEVGETLQEGLARELREETGLSVDVGPVVDVFDRITRDELGRVRYHYVLVDFVCWPSGGVLQAGSDVSEAVVADPADLGRYELTAKTRDVIEQALTRHAAREPRT